MSRVSRMSVGAHRFTEDPPIVDPDPPPGSFSIPDRRNDPNPNLVIDPTGVKDSTAGITNYLNSLGAGTGPSNRVTILWPPGIYRIDDGLTMGRAWTTWQSSLSSNRAQLRQQERYPWRYRPGPSNPNGDAAQPRYWYSGDENLCGWDGEVPGAQHTAGQAQGPRGTTLVRTQGTWHSGQIGAQIEVWYLDESYNSAGGWTGFAAWKIERATISAVAGNGKSLTVTNVVQVNDDGSTTPRSGLKSSFIPPNGEGGLNSQCRNWCVNPRGEWQRYFAPNQAWNPQTYTTTTSNGTPWFRAQTGGSGGYPKLAPRKVIQMAANGTVLRRLKIQGSNSNWIHTHINADYNHPLENENTRGIEMTEGSTDQEIDDCEIHNFLGSNINMDGVRKWVHNSRIYNAGRQCLDLAQAYKWIIEDNVIYASRRSLIDWEPNSPSPKLAAHGAILPIDWGTCSDNVFGAHASGGGRETMACASANGHIHFMFQRNRSLTSDVNAGTIPRVAEIETASAFGPSAVTSPASGCFVWRDNNFQTAIPAIGFRRATNVLYEDNNRQSAAGSEGAMFGVGLTNYMSRGNTINGFTDPKQYQATPTPGSFTDLGNPAAPDLWWRNGGPDPTGIHGRDI